MLISFVIPCHSEGVFLKNAIDSIIVQKIDFIEIIVVLDKATNETRKAALDCCFLDNRITLVENVKCPGPAGSRNLGIMCAKGDWIAFLDGDDLLSSDSLKLRLMALNVFPDAYWIIGDYSKINHKCEVMVQSWYRSRNMSIIPYDYAFESGKCSWVTRPLDAFFNGGMPCTNCVMVKRDVLFKVGLFDVTLKEAEDNHLWLRIAREFPVVFIPHILSYYRVREGSLTQSRKQMFYWTRKSYKKLLDSTKFQDYEFLIKSEYYKLLKNDIWNCRKFFLWNTAFSLIIEGIKIKPYDLLLWKHLFCVIIRKS